MLKKPVALLLALLLLAGGGAAGVRAAEVPAAAQAIPNTLDYEVSAKGAVVLDAQNGRVLYAQNANLRLPMASTTKIMTALITLEQDRLDEYFEVDVQAIHVEGSSMGLREGDSVSLRALAYGMLLPSGNDAANAAAARIAGSQQKFVELMNERAAEIGMEDTHFVTPSGLDAPEHYSTAYDMALLTQEALKNPAFAEICSKSQAVTQFGNPPYNRWLTNHNRLLKSYQGTVGVKTGYTNSAGRCLVSCAQRSGITLITVTLGCPDDWNVHAKLYDRYFGLLRLVDVSGILPRVRVPVVGGEQEAVGARFDLPGKIAIMPDEGITVTATAPPFLFAPVEKGRLVGDITVYCDNQPVARMPLSAAQEVRSRSAGEKSWLAELFGLRS